MKSDIIKCAGREETSDPSMKACPFRGAERVLREKILHKRDLGRIRYRDF